MLVSIGVRILEQFAQFLEQQFGVQTMTYGGWGGRGFQGPQGDDNDKDESGTYALHTLKEDETIAKLASPHSAISVCRTRRTRARRQRPSSSAVIDGSIGTSALTAHKDGAIRFGDDQTQTTGVTGTLTMTNVALSGGYYTNLMVDNYSGVLNKIVQSVNVAEGTRH